MDPSLVLLLLGPSTQKKTTATEEATFSGAAPEQERVENAGGEYEDLGYIPDEGQPLPCKWLCISLRCIQDICATCCPRQSEPSYTPLENKQVLAVAAPKPTAKAKLASSKRFCL